MQFCTIRNLKQSGQWGDLILDWVQIHQTVACCSLIELTTGAGSIVWPKYRLSQLLPLSTMFELIIDIGYLGYVCNLGSLRRGTRCCFNGDTMGTPPAWASVWSMSSTPVAKVWQWRSFSFSGKCCTRNPDVPFWSWTLRCFDDYAMGMLIPTKPYRTTACPLCCVGSTNEPGHNQELPHCVPSDQEIWVRGLILAPQPPTSHSQPGVGAV